VVHRAQEVLLELEGNSSRLRALPKRLKKAAPQLPLFAQKSPVLEELEKLDINSLTPLEALTKLYELQKKGRE
jgi:DNA mismatch repair protein MutS